MKVFEQMFERTRSGGGDLDPASTGHGYATEAVAELLRHSFEDLGVHRVVASCFADNVASWRLMERLGMRRESHTVRDALHRSGEWLDSYGYALLADEWAARGGGPAEHQAGQGHDHAESDTQHLQCRLHV